MFKFGPGKKMFKFGMETLIILLDQLRNYKRIFQKYLNPEFFFIIILFFKIYFMKISILKIFIKI